jgi:general secretion pathway protein F
MAAYQYQAITSSGSSSKGVIEADSERQARQLLREKNLVPIEVQAVKRSHTSKQKNKLSAPDLALFTRQLATLLAAGIPVEESLRGVIEQTEKPKTRQLLMGVRSKVVEGYSLAQAMAEYPLAFPELYQATVAAGEQTGRLDIVLEKLANYTEHQQQTKQKVQQALIYPSLMVTVSITIISFLLAFVVPKIIEVFSTSGQSLPPMTQVLILLSSFVESYGLYFIIFFIIALLIFKRSLKNDKVRLMWDKLLLSLPIFSYLVRTVNMARYIHTFSILFAAGVNVLETMKVSASLLTNKIMSNAFDNATVSVREGTAIHVALKETGFLSPMAVHLIASGEKSGMLAEMMERSASHLDSEVKRIIDTALTLLEPLIILFMGAVVLFIVLATLLPIFSMEQLVI